MKVVLLINELNGDTKAFCHVLQGEGAVGLKELCICLDAHFSDEVPSVRSKVAVTLELLLHPDCVQVMTNVMTISHYSHVIILTKAPEEVVIATIVERVDKLGQLRVVMQHLKDVCTIDDLGREGGGRGRHALHTLASFPGSFEKLPQG